MINFMDEGAPQPFKARKVLFFIHAAEHGGAEMSLLDLLGRINRERFEPSVLCLCEGPLLDEVRRLGVEARVLDVAEDFVRTEREGLFSLRRAPYLGVKCVQAAAAAGLVARHAIDGGHELIYTNSLKAHVIGVLAGREARLPVVWHFRDALFWFPERVMVKALQAAFRPVVIANSKTTASFLVRSRRVRVIYNGIDPESVRAARDAGEVREELGIPGDAVVIGMAGRVQRWKGHEVFLKAAGMLVKDFENVYFVIAGSPIYGDGGFPERLEISAREAKIARRVVFTGFRKDIYDVMQAYDVYVHPTVKEEPFGRGIIEAMALGKPVVASRLGGPSEIVLDDCTGLLVAPGSSVELARAIGRLVIDRTTAAQFGENGRKRVLTQFSMKNHVDGVESALDEVLR
ncbi:MAG: glycosyltransferase family 4 protein, partial [bacterium]